MANIVQYITTKLNLDSKDHDKGLNLSKIVFSNYTAGVLAGVAGITAFAKSQADAIESVQNTATVVGLSARTFSTLTEALKGAGLQTEDQIRLLQKLANPTNEAISIFTKLGVSFRDSAGNIKKSDEILYSFLDRIQSVQSPTDRAKIAFEVFGKSSAKLGELLQLSGTDLKNIQNDFKNLGVELSENQIKNAQKFNDEFDSLGSTFSGLSKNAGSFAISIIDSFSGFDIIKNSIGAVSFGLQGLTNAFIRVKPIISSFFGFVGDAYDFALKKPIEAFLKVSNILTGGIFEKSNDALKNNTEEVKKNDIQKTQSVQINNEWARIQETQEKSIRKSTKAVQESIVQIPTLQDKIKKVTDSVGEWASRTNQLTDSILSSVKDGLDIQAFASQEQLNQIDFDNQERNSKYEADVENLKIAYNNELLALEDKKSKGLISQKDYETQKIAIETTGKSNLDAQLTALDLKKRQEDAQAKQQENDIKYDADLQSFKARRALEITNAIISTAISSFQAFALASATIPPPIGQIVGGVLAGAIATAGAVSIAKAASQPEPPRPAPVRIPQLAEGGYINGPSHAQGGVIANLEGGELVTSRELTRRIESDLKNRENGNNASVFNFNFNGGFILGDSNQFADSVESILTDKIYKIRR